MGWGEETEDCVRRGKRQESGDETTQDTGDAAITPMVWA